MRLERYRKVQIIHRDDFHYYLPQVFQLSLLKNTNAISRKQIIGIDKTVSNKRFLHDVKLDSLDSFTRERIAGRGVNKESDLGTYL